MNKAASADLTQYPWYAAGAWDDLQQGDILPDCPVLVPTEDLTPHLIGIDEDVATGVPIGVETYNLIIMSQSCDLIQASIDQVLLCAFFPADDLTKDQRTAVMKERRPSQHMVEACEIEGAVFSRQVVNFRTLYTLPKTFVTAFANSVENRVRLLPPYREHLSQAFARYFMRVGLPRPLQ